MERNGSGPAQRQTCRANATASTCSRGVGGTNKPGCWPLCPVSSRPASSASPERTSSFNVRRTASGGQPVCSASESAHPERPEAITRASEERSAPRGLPRRRTAVPPDSGGDGNRQREGAELIARTSDNSHRPNGKESPTTTHTVPAGQGAEGADSLRALARWSAGGGEETVGPAQRASPDQTGASAPKAAGARVFHASPCVKYGAVPTDTEARGRVQMPGERPQFLGSEMGRQIDRSTRAQGEATALMEPPSPAAARASTCSQQAPHHAHAWPARPGARLPS